MEAFFSREVQRLDFVIKRSSLREIEKKKLDSEKENKEQVRSDYILFLKFLFLVPLLVRPMCMFFCNKITELPSAYLSLYQSLQDNMLSLDYLV